MSIYISYYKKYNVSANKKKQILPKAILKTRQSTFGLHIINMWKDFPLDIYNKSID